MHLGQGTDPKSTQQGCGKDGKKNPCFAARHTPAGGFVPGCMLWSLSPPPPPPDAGLKPWVSTTFSRSTSTSGKGWQRAFLPPQPCWRGSGQGVSKGKAQWHVRDKDSVLVAPRAWHRGGSSAGGDTLMLQKAHFFLIPADIPPAFPSIYHLIEAADGRQASLPREGHTLQAIT